MVFFLADWRQAYSPVNNEKRDGVQVADGAYPWVKRTPSAANRSMFGVLIFVAPAQLRSPAPRSSARMMMMLGLLRSFTGSALQSAVSGNSSAAKQSVNERFIWNLFLAGLGG